MSREPISVDDGKYTFSVPEGDWRVHVLRHNEAWLIIEKGHNAIASLMDELQEARDKIAELEGRVSNAFPAGEERCPDCGTGNLVPSP